MEIAFLRPVFLLSALCGALFCVADDSCRKGLQEDLQTELRSSACRNAAVPGSLPLAVRNRKSAYSIVLPADPELSRVYAAEELRDYVKRLTGTELGIQTNGHPTCGIYLDRADAGFGDEVFRLRTTGRELHVIGGKRGVLYGVYELLERFGGVGWFASWRTVVPEAERFAVPSDLDETHRPAFAFRTTTWMDVREDHAFRTRLRFNGHGTPDPKYGGEECRFVKKYSNCHSFDKLVPPSRYFKDHPEYFSEVNGIRRNGNAQLCLTNPDVLEIVVSNVLESAAAEPDAQMVCIGQNDCYNFCTCPQCKAIDDEEGSHSGTMVRFLNAVAERVSKVRPDLLLETSAYQYTRFPPKKSRFHPNVLLCLSSIECDFTRPLASSMDRANVEFRRNVTRWGQLCDQLYMWDYTTNYRYFTHPHANIPVLQDNIRFFRNHGVKYLFEEGGRRHGDLAEFRAYLLSKWMWNPELRFEDLAGRFCRGYFGKAAPFAERYLERYLERCRIGTKIHTGCFAFDDPTLFPDEFLEWAVDNWAKAESVVRDDPGALYAVRTASIAPLSNLLNRWETTTPRAWATRSPERFRLPPKAREYHERIQSVFKDVHARGYYVFLSNLKARDLIPRRNWKAMAAATVPTMPSDAAHVTSSALDIWAEVRGGEQADPQAIGGKAVYAVSSVNAACAYFNLSNLAFDDNVRYRVRIHVRADRRPGGRGEAFFAHIGEHELGIPVENISDDGYHWYDLCETELDSGMRFEFASGRFDHGGGLMATDGVWLDCLEFKREER